MRRLFRQIYMGERPGWDHGVRLGFTRLIRYIGFIAQRFTANRCILRAAAMTYVTILTLLPVLVLFFVVYRAFGGLETMQDRVEGFLFTHLLPESMRSIQSYIQTLLSGFNSKAVSVVSILFLVFTAYSLFASVDSSLNEIWNVHRRRRFFSRLVNLWFILTVTPLLIGYSLYLSARIAELQTESIRAVSGSFLWVTPLGLTWLTLFLMYRFIPRTRVHWRSAAIGGFIAGVLWELSKFGFNYYVQNVTNIKLLYGSFILLPLFLIWVELSWMLILLGAELAYVHQHYSAIEAATLKDREASVSHAILCGDVGVDILCAVAGPFVDGDRPVERGTLQARLGMDPAVLAEYLDRLQHAGLVRPVEDDQAYVPGRETSRIPLEAIYTALETDDNQTASTAVKAFRESITDQRRRWLQNRTLYDLVRKDRDSAAGGSRTS